MKTKEKLNFIFLYNGLHYCVPIDNVVEVLEIDKFISSPVTLPAFLGYAEFMKTLVPVFDIDILNNPSKFIKDSNEIKMIVIVKVGKELVSFLIDRFIETICLTDSLDKSKNEETLNIEGQKFISAVYLYNQQSLSEISLLAIESYILINFQSKKLEEQICVIETEESIAETQKKYIELFCFKIGDYKFGMPITDILETIDGYSVSPLFSVSRSLRGVINLRGQIVACFDISECLGLPLRILQEKNIFVVIQHENKELALCVDSVLKIHRFFQDEIQNCEGIISDSITEYVTGIIEEEFEQLFLISTEKVFASNDLKPYME